VRRAVALLMLTSCSSIAIAQRDSTLSRKQAVSQPFVVRTVPLKHLSSIEAMRLLSPYSTTPGGGVYEVSPNVRAVTIRETPAVWTQMSAVLDRYDRESEMVSLTFSLIRADNTGRRDESLAGLDSLLRGVLKFTGYHVVSGAVIQIGEGSLSTQTLVTENNELMRLMCSIDQVNPDASPPTVQLHVTLSKASSGQRVMSQGGQGGQRVGQPEMNVLSTGLTIPMGNTVVIGSGSDGNRGLILTVKPKLGTLKKD
jgi:hypothetical protein